MTRDEFTFLSGPKGQELVQQHLDDSPSSIALRYSGKGLPSAALASQVKYLQRARQKLPTWYNAQCILPGRAFEQCSSEAAAQLKPFISGARALDLTCGLGVDSYFLSQHFGEVVAIEQNPELAEVVRHNFGLLGAANIELRTQTAEDFLAGYTGPPFDLVYLDPDRRDASGGRKFLLADCRPDVLALREKLLAVGHRVMLKVSPMLDITALLRQLDPVDRVTVLALNNECKELLVELGANDGLRLAVTFTNGGLQHRFETAPHEAQVAIVHPEDGDYVYEADISLYKAGLVTAWWQEKYPAWPGGMNHPDGYYFSNEFIEDFPGRVFRIQSIQHYKPAANRTYIQRHGIRRANLSRRYFDLPIRKIKEQLQVSEGGEAFLLFTRMPDGDRVMMHAERLLNRFWFR